MQLENARKVRGIPPQKVIIAENFVKFNKNRNPTIPRSSMDTKIKKTRRKLHKGQAVIEWLNTTEEICTLAAAMKKQQVILVSIRPPPHFQNQYHDVPSEIPASTAQHPLLKALSQLLRASLLCVPEAPGPTPDSTSPRVLCPGFPGPFPQAPTC